MAIVEALLAGDETGIAGERFTLGPGVTLSYPRERMRVPLLIGTLGPATARWAGTVADELKLGGTANPDFVPVARGWLDNPDVRVVVGSVSVVDEDGEWARERARAAVEPYLGVVAHLDPTLELAAGDGPPLDRFCIAGTPEDVADHVRELWDAGADRVELGTPQGRTPLSGVDLVCERVLPSCGRRLHVATLASIDWSLLHWVNAGVATRDWLEDPSTALAALAVPLYAIATIGLWFVARPYHGTRWKLASVSALTAAALAMAANQAIAHVWERPRPYVTHGMSHVLAASSPDPSFPSDHAAAAFAIAFAVLAFSRPAGLGFVAAATLIGLSRIALGLHYPSDVLAGAAVGWASATVVVHLGRHWIGRAVAVLSRLSDPVLSPVWKRLALLSLARRRSRRAV